MGTQVFFLLCISTALGITALGTPQKRDGGGGIKKIWAFGASHRYKLTQQGKEYRGDLTVTKGHNLCQMWSEQSPHKHSNNKADLFPYRHLDLVQNYCRNPDGEPDGPWCYTTNPKVRWEYCDVKLWPGCAGLGKEECESYETKIVKPTYIGNLAVTKGRKHCLRWDSLSDPKDSIKAANFPENNLADAANYCRNPDEDPNGPWCYTGDSRTEWQQCDLKGDRYKDTKLGKEYMGDLAETILGKKCQRWDSQSPHKHSNDIRNKFPDKTVADAANYCRNPDGEPSGPWCYTTDPGTRWEYCIVPLRNLKILPPDGPLVQG